MKDLVTFERHMVALIGRPTKLRPFVCDGSPLDCQAFIVGFNPASASLADFWTFWEPGIGFDKEKLFANYILERQSRPLKPGKTRRNRISNTRRVLDAVLASALPVRCLETNIYSVPSEAAIDLAPHQRSTAPIDYLLSTIKPRVIVAHGDDAIAHIRKFSPECAVIEVAHFSRGFSDVAAQKLGHRIVLEIGDRNNSRDPG